MRRGGDSGARAIQSGIRKQRGIKLIGKQCPSLPRSPNDRLGDTSPGGETT